MNIHPKFLFEYFLELSTKEIAILRHSDGKYFVKNLLPQQKEIINNTHLYFICKKPRFNFIPDTLFFDKNTLTIKHGLKSIADCKNDVDEYIAACAFKDGICAHDHLDIAKRLIKY
ncbi:MAG: hypothetical protein K2P31_03885 [Rickettsiaceae bacterium]|jgi:hypothetical protein|nr:hypothetical protein [Rickettsiaceae bacterium]